MKMKNAKLCWALMLGMAASLGTMLSAQVQTIVPPVVPGAKPVTVEHIKIHGNALEGNLEGDAVDRDALVFLPPSYEKDKKRRYPVIYALHGYSIGAEQWSHEIHVPQTIEGAFAKGSQEMIVVLPDSKPFTTVPCIQAPSLPATSRSSFGTTLSLISTRTTVPLLIGRAVDWSAIPWEAMARRALA